MPSKSNELSEKLKSKKGQMGFSWRGFNLIIGHYVNWVTPSFSQFGYFRNRFESSFNFCLIKNIALEYLPKYEYKEPGLSFVIFMPDARGYDPIILDLSKIEKHNSKSFELLLAHEAHHSYRDQLKKWGSGGFSEIDQALLWAFDQLQAEGVADLIDKKHETLSATKG